MQQQLQSLVSLSLLCFEAQSWIRLICYSFHYGYDKTTIGDVADEIGLNRALVYGYFRSKDDLLAALIKREMVKYGELWFDHLMA
jgi:AcrR family transcriptional regulator